MSSFFSQFSKLAKHISQVIAPPPEAGEGEATRIWQLICNCTLENTKESLENLHYNIQNLIEVIKQSSEQGTLKEVIELLILHQIPSKLVAFSEADIPSGFVNEAIPFFIEFLFPPLSVYLNEPFMTDAINKLIQLHITSNKITSQRLKGKKPHNINKNDVELQFDQDKYDIFIDSLLSYVNSYPDEIEKFIISETSAPFLTEITKKKYFFSKFNEIGEFIFPLLAQTKINPKLHSFLLNKSQLIRNSVFFVKHCIESCSMDSKKRQFLIFLDIALQAALPDFVAAFYSSFESLIVRPLITSSQSETENNEVKVDASSSLKYAIYILTSFSCPHITEPSMLYVKDHIVEHLNSKDPKIVFLAVRCITLIVEHASPNFEEYEKLINIQTDPNLNDPPNKLKYSDSQELNGLSISNTNVKIFLDFLPLLPPEWFVKQDMKQNVENAGSKVTQCHYAASTINNYTYMNIWGTGVSTSQILQKMLKLLENFLDNSLQLNLALTDFFSLIASLPNAGASFFSLSEECEEGLVKCMEEICITAKRRVGKKEDTSDKIAKAYEILGHNWEKEAEDVENGNSETILFINIVTLIEFCKELGAIAQSKNLFHQRDEYFLD